MNKLWNILLYPARLYEKLTDNRTTLAAGIILIGLVDFFLPDIKLTYNTYFSGKPAGDIQLNIIITVFLVLLLGAVDVIFFSVPLFDIFKFFKKKEGLPHHATAVKIMKVYIMSHFILIPVSVLLYFTVFQHIDKNSSPGMLALSVVLLYSTMIWQSAIVTRGINTLFNFSLFFRRLAFIIVFTWSYLFSIVFEMKIEYWLFKLLK